MVALRWGLEVSVVLLLLAVLVQDWRWRGVYWYLFPALALLALSSRLLTQPLLTVAIEFACSAGFLAVHLAAVAGYVWLRFRPATWQWQAYLGLGDILFWGCAALWFSPLVFVLYFFTSLLVSLAIVGLARLWQGTTGNTHIPLAGLQAGYMALLLVCSWIWPLPFLTEDGLLLLLL
ncbi:hypothetical protein [Hymenobacter lucidus]|uniref:Prepilin type IV endopeptidase peptidase domain-containing protein n=1 Tax=Hymenobacter lucidus TaxID=2880930 RepID=A0ABS8AZC3_9BACT|nr:hypothetical protein [Hymenobacter lucidus]MCB2411154.1 hypothetical protein [Hymenobacter lucidus]